MTPRRPGGQTIEAVSLQAPEWERFVAGHPDATPFHQPAWAGVLSSSYRLDAFACVLRDERGAIDVGMPVIRRGLPGRRRAISLPFTDHCPPLLADAARADPERLAARLDGARRAAALRSLEVRDQLAPGLGGAVTCGYRHVLALTPDAEQLFANFHSSRIKRKLRRAEREGVEVRHDRSSRELLDVYYPLHVTTRRRLGVPAQPRRFFERLGRDYLERGLGFVATATAGGVPVASLVILAANGQVSYKYAASSREHGDIGAGQAAVWSALRWACENDCTSFDFGRTDLGHEGLRTYKSAWGSEERELVYTTLADRLPRPGGGRAGEALGWTLRRSPEWLTRGVGRVAYRYTA